MGDRSGDREVGRKAAELAKVVLVRGVGSNSFVQPGCTSVNVSGAHSD